MRNHKKLLNLLCLCILMASNLAVAHSSAEELETEIQSGSDDPYGIFEKELKALEAEPVDVNTVPAQTLGAQVLLAAESMKHSLGLATGQGLKPGKKASGLPKNTRQVKEGYWIGSLPQAGNADALYANRVRLVITATRTKEDLTPLKNRLEELGIKHLMLPFGSKFPKPSRFMSTVARFEPNRIFIHCDHGGDRSGALLAYMLVKKHGWKPEHALLAVLYPGDTDIRGLTQVLNSRGYTISQSDIDKYLGIYSATKNGGGGGLKVRSEDYKKLINTLLDRIED